VLDDYSALRRMTPEVQAKPGQVFPTRKVTLHEEKSRDKALPAGSFVASNPPSGALLTYYLRDAQPAGNKVILQVTNAAGDAVQRIDGQTTPGLHRVSWNPRSAGGGSRSGNYVVRLFSDANGKLTHLGDPQVIEVVAPAQAIGTP
jgi:hypothetical protein